MDVVVAVGDGGDLGCGLGQPSSLVFVAAAARTAVCMVGHSLTRFPSCPERAKKRAGKHYNLRSGSSSKHPPVSRADNIFLRSCPHQLPSKSAATQAAGCELGEPEDVEFAGVPLSMGPRVVMEPSFATTTKDLREKTGPGVQVSSRRQALLPPHGSAWLCAHGCSVVGGRV